MSDNFPASISIGGELILESPYGMLQKDWDEMIIELYECINGSFRDFEENPYNLSSIYDLENNLNSSGHLKICDSQALNGCFQDIEKLCKNLFFLLIEFLMLTMNMTESILHIDQIKNQKKRRSRRTSLVVL